MTNKTFGRYILKDLLGKTGMSSVYAAHDPNFDRDVAVKLLPTTMANDETSRLRFEREAQTIAMLENPAIVPVYDFGEVDGQPFLVMRLMSGGSLSDRIAGGKMDLAEAVRIMKIIGSALDEAHQKGVIHRDLKPGNILFDESNLPYLADFGIAKLTEAATTLTGDVIIGTPAYMSPEQGRGGGDVDRRSDIYSLGVILFEMLTGQLPYSADTPMGQVIKHITAPIPNILELRPDLPAETQTIINRVLSKRKITRYNSATEFAQALEGLLAGGTKVDLKNMTTVADMSLPDELLLQVPAQKGRPTPVPTRRRVAIEKAPTISEKPVKPAARKSRWPVLADALVLVGLLAGGALFLPRLLPGTSTPAPTQAQARLVDQPVGTVTEAVVLPAPTSSPERKATATSQEVEPTPTIEPTSAPEAAYYFPVDNSLYPKDSGEISAANLSSLIKVHVSGRAAYLDIDWSRDGSVVAVGSSTGVYLFGPSELTRQPAWLSAQSPVKTVVFSPDGKALLAVEDHRLVLWDWRSEKQMRVIQESGSRINYAAFSQDSSFLVGGSQDTFVWRVSDGQVLFQLKGVPAKNTSISSDGSLLAAPVGVDTVRIFRVADGSTLADFRLFDVVKVYMLPDGKNVIGITPETMRMWNLQSMQEVGTLGGYDPVFAQNGKSLALNTRQGTLQIWAISENGFGSYRMREIAIDKRYDVSFNLSANGSYIAYWYTRDIQYRTEFTPGNIVVYDVIENAQLRDVKIHGEFVDNPHFLAEFSPDGAELASLANYRHLETMQVASGSTSHELLSQSLTLRPAAFPFERLRVDFGSRNKEITSADGSLRAVVSRSNSSVVSVVETKDNSLVSDISANLVADTDLAFSQDGRTLATISAGGTIRIWNVRTGKQVCVIGGLGPVASIADADRLIFSADGRSLIVYHTDSHLTFWDAGTCQLQKSFELTKNSYSKDHSLFVQLADDGMVFRLFETGAEIGKIYGEYLDAAFSEDGQFLAASMWDGTLHIWGVQP